MEGVVSMADTHFEFDASDWVHGYGVSGAIQSALEDVVHALYVAVAEATGKTPVSDDEFYEYYQEEAGRMLTHEVEEDFVNRFGLEW